MSEQTLEKKIGEFKTKLLLKEFIGGKGQVNFISNEAMIEGKYLTGMGLDDVVFKLTICDEGTVDFVEVDTNETDSALRSRLLETIDERTVTSFRKKTVISELPFYSVIEVSGKKIPLYLSVDFEKPISKLASVFDKKNVEVSEKSSRNLDFLMKLFGEDLKQETVSEEVSDNQKSEKFQNEDWRKSVEDSFNRAKQEKIEDLKKKIQNSSKELSEIEFQINHLESRKSSISSDIELLESRLESLQPDIEFNGHYFNLSENLNEKVELEPEVEKIIRDKISKVKGINCENFMKLFVNNQHQIRLAKKTENGFEEVKDYQNLDEQVSNFFKNSKMNFTIEDGKLLYTGQLAWAEIINRLEKSGFAQDPDWNKVCLSNSYK